MSKMDKTNVERTLMKPVYWRLMFPLFSALLLLIGVFSGVLIYIQSNNLTQSSLEKLKAAQNKLEESLANQSLELANVQELLIWNEDMRKALQAQDRQRLLQIHEHIYNKLNKTISITHFYFHLPNRINLLRVHKPERHDDLIGRFTACKAERTGKTVSGIELGPLGTFTLRVVQPIYEDGRLIGYLELGKEIEDILDKLHNRQDVELAVSIRKKVLKRKDWEAGMKMLGRQADWNRFADDVLIYSSLPEFPASIESFIGPAGHLHNIVDEKKFESKTWHISVTPFKDVSGVEVGDLIIMNDITVSKQTSTRLTAVTVGAALALVIVLLGFLHILLKRTDKAIRRQHAALAESEERQLTLLDAVSNAGVYLFVVDDKYKVRYMNAPMIESFGDAVNQTCYIEVGGLESPCPYCQLSEVIDNEKSVTYQPTAADGRTFDIVAVPFTDIDGTRCIMEVIQDVSKRIEDEKKLEESRNETEKMNRIMTGREIRVLEMKKEVNALLEELGREIKYGRML